MATPVSDLAAASTDARVNGLLEGSAWSFSGPRVLTYSFGLNFDFDDAGNLIASPGGAWTGERMAAFTQALTAWSNVANLSFQQIASGTYAPQSNADIVATLTGTDLQDAGAAALGFFPSPVFVGNFLNSAGYSRALYPKPEGDVFFDDAYPAFSYLAPGGYGLWTMVHEIGHTLGLKHSFDDGQNNKPTFAALGLEQYDYERYTVMSYSGVTDLSSTGHAATPMPLDILAIQHLYGANMSYHAGDDSYAPVLDGAMRTIWDAGGIDTFDARNLTGTPTIDLRPGALMDLGNGTILGVAYNTTLENATGSAGNDTIHGNDADNILTGNGGLNTYFGGLGNDTFVVSNEQDAIFENPGEGFDTLNVSVFMNLTALDRLGGIERIVLTGNSTLDALGDNRANQIIGNALANAIDGRDGDDSLEGGGGNDTLAGGTGKDTLLGGVGTDSISGNAGEDWLDGGTGADSLNGGGGSDLYVVDDPGDMVTESPRVFIERASVAPGGTGVAGNDPQVSADGRFVAFASNTRGLVSGINDDWQRIYVLDMQTGLAVLVSATADGVPSNSNSFDPVMSDDGRYVAFLSFATNLAPDTNAFVKRMFVKDLQSGAVMQVDSTDVGANGHGNSSGLAISSNGRFVVFTSLADNLVAGDSNGTYDVFLKDLQTGTVERVSVANDGAEANGESLLPSVSSDGRIVAFASAASNLVAGDSNGYADIFVRDRTTNSTIRISTGVDGVESDNNAGRSSISNDGRLVVFESTSNLALPGPSNGHRDVFVRDLQSGSLGQVSLAVDRAPPNNSNGQNPAISADGKYVAFVSAATNLDDGATVWGNVFVKELSTGAIAMVSRGIDGLGGNSSSFSPSISADGRYVVFSSFATNLVESVSVGTVYRAVNPFIAQVASDVDTVRSSLSFTLPANVEYLTLVGSEAVNGNGNLLDNSIVGSNMNNSLRGNGGNDTLDGGLGLDSAIFAGNRAAYSITRDAPNARFVVTALSGTDGSDVVKNVELLRFADSTTVLASLASDAGIVNGFSAYRYLAGNLDLLAFYGANPEGGTLHFVNWGFAEGRGFTGFNAFGYLAANTDLLASLGPNVEAAAQHFVQTGIGQGRNSNFDAYRYLASNTDLLPVFGANLDAATDHFVRYGFNEGRGLSFDGLKYLASNPDLILFYGANGTAATEHFARWGHAEGRLANFDGFRYLASNPDLLPVFGANAAPAIDHYVRWGHGEGRQAGFDGLAYIASNPALMPFFGANAQAGVDHFVRWGFAEGRQVNFDGLAYVASYTDLMNSLGANADAGATHFIQSGFAQGRSASFDAQAYLNSNPDLLAFYGANLKGAEAHFINWGRFEGRAASFTGDAGNNVLTGQAGPDTLAGLAGNDSLEGGAGNDTLVGGSGNDSLTGGSGADQFVFNSALNAVTNVDTLGDFSPGNDKLLLDDVVFTQLVVGNLAAGNLAANAGGTAADSNDFLLYNTTTGALSYDADGDGSGAAVQFANFTGNPAITAADFTVF